MPTTAPKTKPAAGTSQRNAPNLASLLIEAGERFKDKPAFATRGSGKVFVSSSFADVFQQAYRLASALIDLGLAPREHVALFADNRYEWILSDLAVILCGAADVPRGSDVTESEMSYIVAHADARFAIVENENVLRKLESVRSHLPKLETIIVMDGSGVTGVKKERSGLYTLSDLLSRPGLNGRHREEIDKRVNEIRGDDLFTLIYTSGTTGAPKGVQLTHANMVSQITGNPFRISPEDRILSILPVWHIFERVFEMFAMANGCCTYYTNVRNLREDMAIVKPTFMASAPRLWESVYQGILTNVGKSSPVRKFLFSLAAGVAKRFRGAVRILTRRELRLKKGAFALTIGRWVLALVSVPVFLLPFLLLDTLVLRKIRKATGGALRGSVSGGGALPYHVDTFFNDIGIPVLEGYGLTETSPVLAVRTFENLVIGTVGPLYRGTELRLVDLNSGDTIYPGTKGLGRSGEIHVRGPQVMKGYYKNPEATSRVMKDGWFNTGDLGVMTWNHCLKIVGRSKDTVVLSGGENVEPVPIENKLLESALIDQCMVVGQDQKFLGALIVPARSAFGGEELEKLAASSDVEDAVRQEIRRLVSADQGFKSFERVIDFRLLPKPFETGDELTAKLSVKRHVVSEKYAALIASMYK